MREVFRKGLCGCLLAAMSLLPVTPGQAESAGEEYPTRVTIRYDVGADRLKGRVFSDIRKCKQLREVRLYRRYEGEWRLQYVGQTSSTSRWASGWVPAGTYKVRAHATDERVDGRMVTCLGDSSPRITI